MQVICIACRCFWKVSLCVEVNYFGALFGRTEIFLTSVFKQEWI